MQQAIMELGLRRAGCGSLAAFMRERCIGTETEAREALMPWVLGYDLWRVRPGDTYASIARTTGSSVRAIGVANPRYVPENLPVGCYLVVPMDFPVVPEDTPWSWALNHYVLRGLQARYPFLGMDVIGKTAYGRPLERVCLGTGPRRVCYNAAHHANEWITAPAVLGCLEQYARAAAFGEKILDQDAAALCRETTLYLVPLVNPDGVDLVCGAALESEEAAARAIAEDYPDIPFPSGWKANLRGTDLNLNYPARWEQAREIKYQLGFTGPAPRDYVGAGPLSEEESRAMYDTTVETAPELVIAWHTQGKEIYWQFGQEEPPGGRSLGLQMARASGYELAQAAFNASFAGYKDWFIQDYDRPGYTVEAGAGENPLPLPQLPEIIRDNLPIFLLGLTGGDRDYVEPALPVFAGSREAAAGNNAPRAQRNPRQLRLPGEQSWG